MEDVFSRYREALRRGHQQAAEGHFKDALNFYRTAAQLAASRALPHVSIGAMLLRLGQPKEALDAYDQALALEPDDIDALSGRAAVLLALGRRSQALEMQQRAAEIRLAADKPVPLVARERDLHGADALLVAGERARAAGDNAVAIDAWLSESREHANGGHFDAALDASLRALSLQPDAPRIHVEMARIYFSRGWTELAAQRVRLLDQLLSLESNDEARSELDRLMAENAKALQA